MRFVLREQTGKNGNWIRRSDWSHVRRRYSVVSWVASPQRVFDLASEHFLLSAGDRAGRSARPFASADTLIRDQRSAARRDWLLAIGNMAFAIRGSGACRGGGTVNASTSSFIPLPSGSASTSLLIPLPSGCQLVLLIVRGQVSGGLGIS